MPVIRCIFRLAARLAALAAALMAGLVAAPAAFAMVPHPGGGAPGPIGTAARQGAAAGAGSVPISGTPGWQIALLVAVVAVLTASIAVRLDRRRTTRHTASWPRAPADPH
jgi:hypothetical protein